VKGKATPQDLETLEALCQMVKNMSLCGLGQSAPNPVLSTLRYFKAEYEALLRQEVGAVR
jgi:bidirectional [NiFe] hydrogenase diaphorase subunit